MKALLPSVLVLAALVSAPGPLRLNAAETKPAQEKPDSRWPKGDLEKAKTLFGDMSYSESGLHWQVLSPGTGDAKPLARDVVKANYKGMLLDGTVFDDSFKRGKPIEFAVGLGQVIPGWDEALMDMKKGEKRRLVIPYWLGYGFTGAGSVIPPKATLVFEVELLDWTPAPGH